MEMEMEAEVEDDEQKELVTLTLCAPSLRTLWRQANSPLPALWHAQYPDLFDADDLKLAEGKQRQNHFAEWVAAFYLFKRDGSVDQSALDLSWWLPLRNLFATNGPEESQ
jgi:hypothetical protein